jgi:hypothetical protein
MYVTSSLIALGKAFVAQIPWRADSPTGPPPYGWPVNFPIASTKGQPGSNSSSGAAVGRAGRCGCAARVERRCERAAAELAHVPSQIRSGPMRKFVAEGLAVLRQTLSPVPERSSKPSQASVAASQPSQEAATLPTPPALGDQAQPGPSFDCAKARSVPEKMICSDAELARLDRKLGRVYARAKTIAADGAAFRRQNSEE